MPDGVWKLYYLMSWRKNHVPHSQYTYKNGMLNGAYKSFDDFGGLSDSGMYLNNMKDGRWTSYNLRGQEREVMTYRNDTLHGYFRSTNGSMEGQYVNGKMDGKVIFRHSEGDGAVGHYKMDARHGLWIIKRYGTTEIKNYENDTLSGLYQNYRASGRDSALTQRGYYEKGLRIGIWEHYSFCRNTRQTCLTLTPYANGLMHGRATSYYPNGDTMSIDDYVNGKELGFRKEWDDSGRLIKLHFRKQENGCFYDSFIRWNFNGRLMEEHLNKDKHPGEYHKWYMNGQLEEKDSFYLSGGKRMFDHYSYRNGIITDEYHILDGKKHGRWYLKGWYELTYKNGVVIKRIKETYPPALNQVGWHYFGTHDEREIRDVIAGDRSRDDDEYRRRASRFSFDPYPDDHRPISQELKEIETLRIYPDEADSLKLKGEVIFRCLISPDGHLCCPKLLKSLHPAYDAQALRAVILLLNNQSLRVREVHAEWLDITVPF